MPRQKGVKFQHRNGSGNDVATGNGNGNSNSNGSRHRRSSSSTISDSASEPPSPRKEKHENIMNGSLPKGDRPAEESEYEKKKQTFITRLIWSLVMIGCFFGAMFAGHIYVLMVITAVQVISFKEVLAIAQVPTKQKNLPLTTSLNWYFLAMTMYFLYGESVIYYFKHILLVDKVLLPFATHHRFISFMMYIIGFISFVASLRKGYYRFQFSQFAWTHMALYLIVVQAHFMMNNVLEGMIWFFLPVSLVITNDIFAYICGITFGRTQLISLSPKKTVEGFVGAWICTIFFGFALTNLLMRYSYFTCPVNDLGANVFTGLQCDPNPVFKPYPYDIQEWTGLNYTFWVSPMQGHIFALATFASLIAPFGGFFASGLKRTFKIKDFGDSIPGHGGMVDRMDCQFIMGLFSYMYYQSFIAVYKTSVGGVLETAIMGLTPQEQIELLKRLGWYLQGQGIVSNKVEQCLSGVLTKK